MVGVWLERLEYADDAALIDVGYEMASAKVSELVRVARVRADMEISRPKTEYMAVRDFEVTAAVQADYDEFVFNHHCPDCGRGFVCRTGMNIHRGGACKRRGLLPYEIDRIVDVRGHPNERFYRVRYTGFGPNEDRWRNWRDLDAQETIDDFWDISGLDKSMPAPWK